MICLRSWFLHLISAAMCMTISKCPKTADRINITLLPVVFYDTITAHRRLPWHFTPDSVRTRTALSIIATENQADAGLSETATITVAASVLHSAIAVSIAVDTSAKARFTSIIAHIIASITGASSLRSTRLPASATLPGSFMSPTRSFSIG